MPFSGSHQHFSGMVGGTLLHAFLTVVPGLIGGINCLEPLEWYTDPDTSQLMILKRIRDDGKTYILGCDHVKFYLVTRDDPNGNTEACLDQNWPPFDGKLNITKPTKILVHGWRDSRKTPFTRKATAAYLTMDDVNVIQTDWHKDAQQDYFIARHRVPQVGYTLAKFIERLIKELEVVVSKVELVGFSLGAQVVGIAGYYTTPKVPLVIGLDPAGPLFETEGPKGKITRESGKFVVILHACKYRLGTFEDLGHLNFNANSGMSQPGCGEDLRGTCSHSRAPLYFAASLLYPEGFLSNECYDYIEYELGLCDDSPTTYFTGSFNTSLRGTYYFETTSKYPFIISNNTSKHDWPLRQPRDQQNREGSSNRKHPRTRNFKNRFWYT